MKEKQNHIGEKYNRLTVKEEKDPKIYSYAKASTIRRMFLCSCDCGKEVIVDIRSLKSGNTKSCGCYFKETTPYNKTHGLSNPNTRGTLERDTYGIWAGMKQRCLNSKAPVYKWYGGKGVTVCKEWLSFEGFIKDMGYKPNSEATLDRIDSNGNYEPGNCRWATQKEQANNTTRSVKIEYNGSLYTIEQLSDIAGIKTGTIKNRIKYGWDIKSAVELPADKRAKNRSKKNTTF